MDGATKLQNEAGFSATLLDRGAGIQAIGVPTSRGVVQAVLGYRDSADYRSDRYYLGVTVGRYANRIRAGALTLPDGVYPLPVDPRTGHCLHGGPRGFHSRIWRREPTTSETMVSYRLRSPDRDQGFPGELAVAVTYTLLPGAALAVDYLATTTQTTAVSLTNHAYFNLHGDGSTVDGHRLSIRASRFTPTDRDKIPTGEVVDTRGTPMDFRADRLLGANDVYDVNFALDDGASSLRPVATLSSPKTGLCLIVHTTQPALQLYTGDGLGEPFAPRAGLCLETQQFPDAPNCPAFPSAVLTPDQVYTHRTVFEFHELPV
ncbi:MAG: aldose epimerase family protein [Pseudomonadota bacterium]